MNKLILLNPYSCQTYVGNFIKYSKKVQLNVLVKVKKSLVLFKVILTKTKAFRSLNENFS